MFEDVWEKMKLNELERQTFCQWVKRLESCTDNTLSNREENGSGQKMETYLVRQHFTANNLPEGLSDCPTYLILFPLLNLFLEVGLTQANLRLHVLQ